jgi:delta-1-pyrroline-5-carboxylate synthetase
MRTHLKASKFVVVKAGTSTVSHDDGTPSLPRLGAIVEAVSQLMRQGTKVILVSSGAVGCGRSVLRKQAALHRTLRDHMKSQEMNEGIGYSAAAAAAGQLALMSLYETLFATQEIEPSQFLVTRRDFVDEACRKNLQHSIQAIMDVGMVPIINENDAVSGNAGYSEVPDGCFSDNDGLAALVAKLVGADCLIMLTDVEGLYDRPPSEAGARLVREVHPASLKDWKFGGISKGGRGGMEAKVNAALGALEVGVKSVVLASGSEKEVLQRCGRGVFFIITSPRRHRRDLSHTGSSPATTSAPTSATTSRGSRLWTKAIRSRPSARALEERRGRCRRWRPATARKFSKPSPRN